MAVERVDVNIQGFQPKSDTRDQITSDDQEAAVKRKADVKIAEKAQAAKAQLAKQGVVARETFQRSQEVQQRYNQVLGGAAGHDVAGPLNQFHGSPVYQKLTPTQ